MRRQREAPTSGRRAEDDLPATCRGGGTLPQLGQDATAVLIVVCCRLPRRTTLLGASRMFIELHEVDRREIFFRVVRMQDQGVSLEDSRSSITAQFGIDVDQMREIETEGIAKEWPPL